jgi:hypothetical protein
MNVTIFVKKTEFDEFINFYYRINHNEQILKENVPKIKIYEERPKAIAVFEISLQYDIFQGMKYVLEKTKDFDFPISEDLDKVSYYLKRAENFNLQDSVVLSALKNIKSNNELLPEEAMRNALEEYEILK